MSALYSLIAPLIMACIGIYALFKRVDIFSALVDGAADGLKTVWRIAPPLICLLSAIYMFRASGALDALTTALSPVLELLGIPAETASLMLLRPFSGSGALAIGAELINEHGADSLIGRSAAVMLGSTETTFYVMAIYFGAAGIKRSRHALPSALIADLVGFVTAALVVKFLF